MKMKLVFLPFSLLLAVSIAGCGPSSTGGDDDDAPGGDGGNQTVYMDGGNPGCTGAGCLLNCPAGTSTKISGRVFVPKGDVPVPFARVYVAKSKTEFSTNVGCEVCSSPQDPAWVSTSTDVSGRFELDNVPVPEGGGMVELAVQKGRFRKFYPIQIDDCATNDLNTMPAFAKLTLPKNKSEGNIPKIAVATGDWDAMECVLGQNGFGLDNDAFDRFDNLTHSLTDPGFPPIVPPSTIPINGGTQGTQGTITALIGDRAKLMTYNIIFLNCSSDELEKTFVADATMKANLEEYVRSGGRLYVTDWSYGWIEQTPQFSKYITFQGGAMGGTTPEMANAAKVGGELMSVQAKVVQSKLLDWLVAIEQVLGAGSVLTPPDQVRITHWLFKWAQMASVLQETNGSKLWVQDNAAATGLMSRPLTVTFDYNQCGRVLYSSYHTLGRRETIDGNFPVNGAGTMGTWMEFPGYCSTAALAAQERILEYLILEVSDCIQIG